MQTQRPYIEQAPHGGDERYRIVIPQPEGDHYIAIDAFGALSLLDSLNSLIGARGDNVPPSRTGAGIPLDPDKEYVFSPAPDGKGLWIDVDGLAVNIGRFDGGVQVDLYPSGDLDDPIAQTWADTP